MSSKKKPAANKNKKSARKPRSGATRNKQQGRSSRRTGSGGRPRPRPHAPTLSALPAVAEPVELPAAEPVVGQPVVEQPVVEEPDELVAAEPHGEPVTFSGADPAAWAWLNTWPFLDDAAASAESVDEAIEPLASTQPRPEVDEDLEPLDDEDDEGDEGDAPWWVGPPVAAAATYQPPVTRRRSAPTWGLAAAAVVAVAAGALGVWWSVVRPGGPSAPEPGDAYAPPVRLVGDRALVRSHVLPSGDLRVRHWIHTNDSVDSVALRLPTVAGLPVDAIRVRHLVVAATGVALPTVQQPEPDVTETIVLPPTHSIYVTYVLSGAVQHSPGPAGRALARLTSLEVTTDSAMARTTQSVAGARVLALACSTPEPTALPHPCGVERHGSWHVALGRAEAQERVMAQLDLS